MVEETGHVDFYGDSLILEVLEVLVRRFLAGIEREKGRERWREF